MVNNMLNAIKKVNPKKADELGRHNRDYNFLKVFIRNHNANIQAKYGISADEIKKVTE